MATERRGGHHDDVRAHDVWLYAPLPPPTCIHTFHFISWLAPSPADDDHAWIAFLFFSWTAPEIRRPVSTGKDRAWRGSHRSCRRDLRGLRPERVAFVASSRPAAGMARWSHFIQLTLTLTKKKTYFNQNCFLQ